jgi:hypothetical protein
MLAGAVRIALLAYPSGWRRRYGDELQELTIAVLADRRTFPGRLVVLSGVVGHGVAARMGAAESTRGRVAVTSISVLMAIVVVAASIPSDELFVQNAALSPLVRLGSGVSVIPSGRTETVGPGRSRVIVQAPLGVNPQISVAGAPAAVVIDPKSVQVLSVGRLSANRRR